MDHKLITRDFAVWLLVNYPIVNTLENNSDRKPLIYKSFLIIWLFSFKGEGEIKGGERDIYIMSFSTEGYIYTPLEKLIN